MRDTLPLLALASLLAGPAAGATETYVVDKNHSEVTFQVRHLGISNVGGRFEDFAGSIRIDRERPEASSVEFSIQAASINTNAPARDKDLRSADFFDVERFPSITFQSSKVLPRGGDRYDVTGTLSMHGVSREVTLPVSHIGFVTDQRGRQKAGFELATTLSRKDYGITWNKVLESGGLVVSDEVRIAVNLEATKQEPPSPAP